VTRSTRCSASCLGNIYFSLITWSVQFRASHRQEFNNKKQDGCLALYDASAVFKRSSCSGMLKIDVQKGSKSHNNAQRPSLSTNSFIPINHLFWRRPNEALSVRSSKPFIHSLLTLLSLRCLRALAAIISSSLTSSGSSKSFSVTSGTGWPKAEELLPLLRCLLIAASRR
jgi:hypothetical protein